MTDKLYYQDAYLKEFQAAVTAVRKEKNSCRVQLDRTAFYPEGGGQGADRGVLCTPGGREWSVTDVQEEEDQIWHYLDSAAELSEGECVTGRIDWSRRFDHMQQHSGEHIVSGMLCSRFDCSNVGFHLGEDVVTIDYDARITMEQAVETEKMANTYIWEDHPLLVHLPDAETLRMLTYRSKKELTENVRLTEFPGADICACCGTHVSSSAQVGLVKFLSAKPFHEGTRLELLCGKRAMQYLSMNHQVNKSAAVLLSTNEENTADRVQRLIEENISLKADLAEAESRLIELMTEPYKDKGNVLVIDSRLSAVQGRNLADKIADCCGGCAAVFTGSKTKYQYALLDKQSKEIAFVKELNEALNGRGGGRNGFAQGSVNAGKKEIRLFFEGMKHAGGNWYEGNAGGKDTSDEV